MKGIKVIIKKELARVFGDKKLVFSLFILPAILMIGLYSLMGKLMTGMVDDIEKHVPTIYVENAPDDFVDYVKASKYSGEVSYSDNNQYQIEDSELGKITVTIEDLKEHILEGTADLIISFEDGFLEKVENYTPGDVIPEVKTYYNPSEDYSAEARETFVSGVLSKYQQELLRNRVGNLDSLIVFHVDVDPTTSIIQNEEKANGKFLAMMMPYMIVMLLFTGPMSLGVDAITGEKERGTMASMLLTPVKRSEIVMGKLISLSLLSCLSAIVYGVSIIIAIPLMYSGIDDTMGASAQLSVLQIAQLLAIMLIIVYLYVAIVSLVSVFAKNAKEAGTYVSPAFMVVMVAGMITMFSGNSETAFPLFGIPVYGSALSIQRIMTNELTLGQFGINILGTVIVAAILTTFITKAFNSEKVMFNA